MVCLSRSPLLLLVLGAPVALGQSCPAPDSSIACTKEYDPVTCNGCSYENLCEATAAGQASCVPSCAEPAADTACTLEYAPVACGGDTWCIYDNLCLAKAAGKTDADCSRSCPAVPDGTACTLDFSPQFCGGCFYDSLCLATAAWEAAGLSADNCVDITEYVSPAADTNTTTCPEIAVPTSCPSTFAPVTCDGNCFYNNECLATEAGANNCASTCSPPPDSNCDNTNAAFICRNGCTYRNSCFVEAAGLTPSSDCAPICRFDLESVSGSCPSNYEPIFCLGCTFDNSCIASALGFNVNLDCQSIATPTVAQGSPSNDTTTTTSDGTLMQSSLSKMVIAPLVVSYLFFA